MKALLVCVAATLLASSLRLDAQTGRAVSDQDTLIEIERSWNDAVYRKDVELIGSFLADEFIATYPDGSRGDKRRELLMVEEFNQQVDSAIQDEFVVKVYGNTAVVWFTLHMVGPKQGKPTPVDMRYVDVFVLRDGRWQCVSSTSTRVTP